MSKQQLDDASVIAGATVLVTGAARGMGELYARRATAEGAKAIALWDIDEARVTALAEELQRAGVDARAFVVDVSKQETIREGVEKTVEALGAPDILVNNAGIVRGARFWDHDPTRDIELTMRINTLGPMWLTREVLPAMMQDRSRQKRILNIASAAGTVANPNMSLYASSKWAVIGWSESLRLELEKDGYRHIGVTAFCPSYVSTGMFEGARGPLLTPILTPERAVDAAWEGMKAGQPLVLKPWTVKLAMAVRGVLPTKPWDLVAGKIFGVYSSMDHFTGRKEA